MIDLVLVGDGWPFQQGNLLCVHIFIESDAIVHVESGSFSDVRNDNYCLLSTAHVRAASLHVALNSIFQFFLLHVLLGFGLALMREEDDGCHLSPVVLPLRFKISPNKNKVAGIQHKHLAKETHTLIPELIVMTCLMVMAQQIVVVLRIVCCVVYL